MNDKNLKEKGKRMENDNKDKEKENKNEPSSNKYYNKVGMNNMNMNNVNNMVSKMAQNPSVSMTAPLPASVQGGQMPNPIDFDKIKSKLEDFKKKIMKKYNFTIAIGVLPGQAAPLFEEDEQIPKEISDTKPLYVFIIIPEEQFKNIPKIKPEIIKFVKETGENIWLMIKTPVDLWNYGLDSKFEFIDAISACFPLHDNGFLGALRVANIHKSLVLRKFEKYVATYAIGGSLVRGTAGKDSDVDVFVVIDDTDVKRMSRIELLEKLRGIIYDYIREATALAGVKNILNVQVYLLTDFWQSVKDAHPVMFTFIRDGIPLYDRGTFIPWKLLLKMGRIKPSPEAIDLYMKQGEQTEEFVKRRLLDAMVDIYYGVVTPTQAMMMLAGEAPPVPKTIVADVKKVLIDKEKVMDEKNLKILEKAVHLFKQYEYGKLKEYAGTEIDKFLSEAKEYNKMLKKMREKIEKKLQEKTAEDLYENVFKLLKTFFGEKTQAELIKDFETQMVRKGKIQGRYLAILKELVQLKGKIKSGKLNQKEVDSVKANSIELMNSLVEYGQRTDLISAEKGTMLISYGNRKAELVLMGKENFLIEGKDIKKISDGKIISSNREEFEKAFIENKGKLKTKISGEIFNVLEKELGKFELEF
ncbi:nucleotidyltransferase domain-containing protein [Candidatus Pacearchaeota archaeon]|nr:nucleotidyltransferase domain-containing protein [Candidatus Pacearchaeota archaeon]